MCRAEGTLRPPPGGRRSRTLSTLLVALGVVFLAELGDKSQLVALSLAARRPPLHVLTGLAGAALVLQGLSAGLGAVLGDVVPTSAVAVVAGLGFLVAAALVLRGEGEPEVAATPSRRSTVLVAFSTLLVAELGDKTMIATAALATTEPAWLVWLGGTAGFVLADALAVLVGVRLFRGLPVHHVRRATAALLAVLGVLMLAGTL